MNQITNAQAAALRNRLLVMTSALALATGAASTAAAQVGPAEEEAQSTGLEDVIVTAQRRSETSQRAAIAIDVVGAEELSNAGIVTAATLNAAVPALVITKAGGANTSFYVRGVGNFTVNAYADPAIAFNLDGVYLGRPTSTTGTFFDLERVEVLKGPQGTLYGRNATGGAVNVLPVKPILGETSGYGAIGYGRFNALDLEAAFNLPLGDRFALRVAGKWVDSEGYMDDGTSDEVGQGLRVQLLGDITDSLRVRLSADYSHQGGVGPGASLNGRVVYSPGTPATGTSIANYTYLDLGFDPYSGLHSPQARAAYSTFTIPGAFINPAPNEYPEMDNTYRGVSAEITLDTGVGTFTLIPAYRDAELNSLFNGPGFRGGLIDETDEQISVELRLDGKSIGPIDWLVGAYYFDESIDGLYTFSQYQINSFQDFTTGTESKALFGRTTWNVTDTFRLVGGLRYTEDLKRFDSVAETLVQICTRPAPPTGPGCFGGPSVPVARSRTDLPFTPIPTVPGPPNGVAFGTFGNRLFFNRLTIPNREVKTDRITYRLAAEYDVGPASLLYASYETGYRGGGFSNAAGFETYAPEYIKAATIGSKNRFLDNTLQLNVELFRWEYTNQQVTHFGFDATGNSNLFTENIGASTVQGADIDLRYAWGEATTLRGSVQYLDNTLDSFIYTTPRGGTNLPPVTGCAVSNGTQGALLNYVVDCSGQPGFNSPEWSVNAGVDRTFELGQYELTLSADGRYRSDRVIGFDRIPQESSGSDLTFDVNGKISPIDGPWTVSAYVRNITDEAVPVLAQYNSSIGGSVATNYAPPRTYGVRISSKF